MNRTSCGTDSGFSSVVMTILNKAGNQSSERAGERNGAERWRTRPPIDHPGRQALCARRTTHPPDRVESSGAFPLTIRRPVPGGNHASGHPLPPPTSPSPPRVNRADGFPFARSLTGLVNRKKRERRELPMRGAWSRESGRRKCWFGKLPAPLRVKISGTRSRFCSSRFTSRRQYYTVLPACRCLAWYSISKSFHGPQLSTEASRTLAHTSS
jgi:hypothetical protein